MHQPIALEDEAVTGYYPQVLTTQQSSVTLHTIYSISQDQARRIVEQAIAEHERRFSRYGVLTAVLSVVLGGVLCWLAVK